MEEYNFSDEHSNLRGLCLFNILSKYLNRLKKSDEFTIKKLKNDCLNYANENLWVRNIVIEKAKLYYDNTNYGIWEHYTPALMYDSEQVSQMERSTSPLEQIIYRTIVKREFRNISLGAICGQLDIEGRILQEIYGIKIVLVYSDDDIKKADADNNIIYLIKTGLNHFIEYMTEDSNEPKPEKETPTNDGECSNIGKEYKMPEKERENKNNICGSIENLNNITTPKATLTNLNNLGCDYPKKNNFKNIEIEQPNVRNENEDDNESKSTNSESDVKVENTDKLQSKKKQKNRRSKLDKLKKKENINTDLTEKKENINTNLTEKKENVNTNLTENIVEKVTQDSLTASFVSDSKKNENDLQKYDNKSNKNNVKQRNNQEKQFSKCDSSRELTNQYRNVPNNWKKSNDQREKNQNREANQKLIEGNREGDQNRKETNPRNNQKKCGNNNNNDNGRRGRKSDKPDQNRNNNQRDRSNESIQSNASSRYSSCSNLNIFGASDDANTQNNLFYDWLPNIQNATQTNVRQKFKFSKCCSYDGFLNEAREFDGFGKICDDSDRRQFIEGVFNKSNLSKLKLVCFVFSMNRQVQLYVRIYAEDNLLTINRCIVAKIVINQFAKIDWDQTFQGIGMEILKNVKIVRMLEDGTMERKNAQMIKLINLFNDGLMNTTTDVNVVNMYLQMCRICSDLDQRCRSNIFLLEQIATKKFNFSINIMKLCHQIWQEELKMRSESNVFPILKEFRASTQTDNNLFDKIKKISMEAKEVHKNKLLELLNSNIIQAPLVSLNKLKDYQLFYIHPENIEIFNYIEMALPSDDNNRIFWMEILCNIWTHFIESVNQMKIVNIILDIPALSHRIYVPLIKIFIELATELAELSGKRVSDIIVQNFQEIKLIDNIKLPNNGFVNNALKLQIKFVIDLMKHFKPGVMKKEFVYQRFFKKSFPADSIHTAKSLQLFEKLNSNIFDNLPPDHLIWVYILDYTLSKLMHDIPNSTKSHYYGLSYTLIECLIQFMRKNGNRQESIRLILNNIILFMAKIAPYISKIDLNSTIDQHILEKQIDYLNFVMIKQDTDLVTNCLSNVIDVYGTYWNNRDKVISKLPKIYPCGTFEWDTDQIYQLLLTIVKNTVDKLVENKINMELFVTFMRAYNEFVEDLDDVEYKWYVKKNPMYNMNYLELVNNKLADEEKCTYLVKNVADFMRHIKQLQLPKIPDNYEMKIIIELLIIINNALQKHKWSDKDTAEIACNTRIEIASQLLAAIRSSFLYLKEQPDYREFELFFEESTKPFFSVIMDSMSKADFDKRCLVIKESFWYIRKQNEIGIDEALNLFAAKNPLAITDRNILQIGYEIYQRKFNEFITNYYADKSIDNIVNVIENKVATNENQHKWSTDKWTISFKQDTIPMLLAGLAAVWSIQQSKDMSSKETSLKPHCIQIICILRLLSIDQATIGVQRHLAEVLTGQGKSLVLALTAALLVLLKCNVKILCYSNYLSNRDKDDFQQFYKTFKFETKINYQTFEEMANELLYLNKGSGAGIRDLVRYDILNEKIGIFESLKNAIFGVKNEMNTKKTILLIDEVDVFFMDRFFGETYKPGTLIGMETIKLIQEIIWTKTKEKQTFQNILQIVDNYIQDALIQKTDSTFLSFYNKTTLSNLYGKNRMNKDFLKEEIGKMIQNSKYVYTYNTVFVDHYHLDNNDNIIFKNKYGEIETATWEYYNCFYYLFLKKNNFATNNYKNYGYISILSGRVSYAELPKEYPLILGVTGTLATLSTYQKEIIGNMYNIRLQSLMPSFYGPSNIKWDSQCNTIIEQNELSWLCKIFMESTKCIQQNRAVLICFNTEIEIQLFEKKFGNEIAFLNKLTFNTTNKEYIINEAGVKKNITLLTSGMGRGTDFKTSVTVEKNGGCHVIQTFFSEIENEEIQIRGRTARKDNKGSYQLILCRAHLDTTNYTHCFSYTSLDIVRKKNNELKSNNKKTEIQESADEHEKTMSYLNSLS